MSLGGNQKIGKIGENLAATYLAKKGYKILAMNQRMPGGEVDITAVFGTILVLVEVKTLNGGNGIQKTFMNPEDNLTFTKKRFLHRAARYSMNKLVVSGSGLTEARIDVVAIILMPSGRAQIRHYRNALAL
jgi:putative endonuclease